MKHYYKIVGLLMCCLLAACGGTHGNVGQYWAQGDPDKVYDLLRTIAGDSASGVELVDNESFGTKPYMKITITAPRYAIKGITIVVSDPVERNGTMGCLISIAYVRRKDGNNCSSGKCESTEIAQGQQAADQFLINPLRRTMRVDFLDSWF